MLATIGAAADRFEPPSDLPLEFTGCAAPLDRPSLPGNLTTVE
jgi:hypothetical protein